jgi:hypothetical protein
VAERSGAVEQLIAFLVTDKIDDPDWPELVEAAGNTLTIGILADRVLERADDLDMPAPIKELLADIRGRARQRNARIREQFSELVGVLNAMGVEPIAMKGLARLLSPSSCECRLLSDIDILVPAERQDDCAAAMRDLGYVALDQPAESPQSVFARAQDVGSVDLHTELKPNYLQCAYEQVAPFCRPTKVAGGTVLLPSPTCQAMMLIAHDQLHDADYWRGLVDVRHLLDLHELVGEGVDWPLLIDLFPTGVPRRALELGLLTARSFVGSDIPTGCCGASWTRIQLERRRLQARLPFLQQLLTLLTIAADPPQVWRTAQVEGRPKPGWRATLYRRLTTYLRPNNPGKISFGVRVN